MYGSSTYWRIFWYKYFSLSSEICITSIIFNFSFILIIIHHHLIWKIINNIKLKKFTWIINILILYYIIIILKMKKIWLNKIYKINFNIHNLKKNTILWLFLNISLIIIKNINIFLNIYLFVFFSIFNTEFKNLLMILLLYLLISMICFSID